MSDLQPGTPLGIPGHLPHVPQAAGVPPWCSCGYRWNPRDPASELVGVHISRLAAEQGIAVADMVPGYLC